MTKPVVLCILDGCGMRDEKDGNAFLNAKKPNFDYLWQNYPHSLLTASGTKVGLPEGQMGNSEVGHMNMGAGRIVYQPLELINQKIKDGSFKKNKELIRVMKIVKKRKTNLHIMGLLSDGGVHSHINHLLTIMEMAKELGLDNLYLHLFLDGRDVEPHSSLNYIKLVENKIKELNLGTIATISGRYYAMDRDNNYDRLALAYEAIVNGNGPIFNNPEEMIKKSYDGNVTDEFIKPGIINKMTINDGDGVIGFNFRPDRLRELFTALTNPYFTDMAVKKIKKLEVVTMMPVVKSVMCPYAYKIPELKNTLGEYLAKKGLTQLRIAETEKYAHVTYFFDGGKEKDYPGMKKILIPSPKVATYDLKPEMSAEEITNNLLAELDTKQEDVVILNFANGDMVGHTGVYEAAVKGVEAIDECLGKIIKKVRELNGILIVTADHGNCEVMWDEKRQPVTSHTTNLVPFIITQDDILLYDGKLADIAPTILDVLEIKKPKEMTGNSLIK